MSSYGKRNLPMVSKYEVGKKRDFRSQVSKHRVLVVFFSFSRMCTHMHTGCMLYVSHMYTIAVCLEEKDNKK